ncbi:MAG: nucleotide sugar dehydrogenase [Christensenellales bacterium]|jgi:UDP-N-acetyl-D-mannosaminuronic acid dehydrogenase
MRSQQICILGMGYIGLPTAALFARSGVRVHGVDVNPEICEGINTGRICLEEPGLQELVRESVEAGMLTVSAQPVPADAFIIAVPTPITPQKKADLSFVAAAAQMLVPVLKKGDLVILESTVPPLCTQTLLVPELEKTGLSAVGDFNVAHCPERVLPGQIIHELINNSRIIGGYTEEGAKRAADLYAVFVKGELCVTDAATAEMCKLMENTFRDVNIALANELAQICDHLHINAWDVIHFANKHPRVHLHQPGPGVGGHCLAVDPWFIVEKDPETAKIIGLSRRTNDGMPHYVAEKIQELSKDGKVLLLGCTYKPDVDDVRESPAIELSEILTRKGYRVEIYDPHVPKYAGALLEKACDAVVTVLAVNHSAFSNIDYAALKEAVKLPVLLDTRNCSDMQKARAVGFECYLLGGGVL